MGLTLTAGLPAPQKVTIPLTKSNFSSEAAATGHCRQRRYPHRRKSSGTTIPATKPSTVSMCGSNSLNSKGCEVMVRDAVWIR
eukprot:2484465-Pyramimonas_sp.AAC.2